MPIVLTQNDRTAGGHYDHWKDVTGERYQFPNKYKNKVVAGTPFVYYRGIRLAGGGRRDSPEYFGCGRIGEVWRDPEVPLSAPKNRWKWYCWIEDYVPFSRPIPWRRDGRLFEDKPQHAFRDAVRSLYLEEFKRILDAAGLPPSVVEGSEASAPSMPPLAEVAPTISEVPLLVPVPARAPDSVSVGDAAAGPTRRSKTAKAIGDRAEEMVLSFLEDELPPAARGTLQWVAREGLKLGYDIQYCDGDELTAVEVKGTSGPLFASVEVTAQEWRAAESFGERYWLYLVADCLSMYPSIQCVQAPFALSRSNTLRASPLVWRLERVMERGS